MSSSKDEKSTNNTSFINGCYNDSRVTNNISGGNFNTVTGNVIGNVHQVYNGSSSKVDNETSSEEMDGTPNIPSSVFMNANVGKVVRSEYDKNMSNIGVEYFKSVKSRLGYKSNETWCEHMGFDLNTYSKLMSNKVQDMWPFYNAIKSKYPQFGDSFIEKFVELESMGK